MTIVFTLEVDDIEKAQWFVSFRPVRLCSELYTLQVHSPLHRASVSSASRLKVIVIDLSAGWRIYSSEIENISRERKGVIKIGLTLSLSRLSSSMAV